MTERQQIPQQVVPEYSVVAPLLEPHAHYAYARNLGYTVQQATRNHANFANFCIGTARVRGNRGRLTLPTILMPLRLLATSQLTPRLLWLSRRTWAPHTISRS